LGKPIRVKPNVARLYWRVERGRSQGGGANGLRRARGSPPAANGGDNGSAGDADDAALSQSPQEPPKRAGLVSRSLNRSQKHGYDRHHR
jgi:hypothetical protein